MRCLKERNDKNGQVVHLDAHRKIADLELDGMPHRASGITWKRAGKPLLATPHRKMAEVMLR